MIFTVIMAGFIAQMAIIGPSARPVQNDRDSENIPSIAAPQIDKENDKKLKQLKVAPAPQPSERNTASQAPSLQASLPSTKASPKANENSSNSAAPNSNDSQSKPAYQLCLLKFCL